MNRATRTLSVLAVAGMILVLVPSGLWAESAIPDAGAFFGDLLDPNAPGTKVFGTLTIAYVFTADPPPACEGIIINNMFVVATLAHGNDVRPFNRDFSDTVPVTQPFCFNDTDAQVTFVLGLLTDKVIPHFFGPCGTATTPACPSVKVKSITDFLSSGTGAVSANITLAVQ